MTIAVTVIFVFEKWAVLNVISLYSQAKTSVAIAYPLASDYGKKVATYVATLCHTFYHHLPHVADHRKQSEHKKTVDISTVIMVGETRFELAAP